MQFLINMYDRLVNYVDSIRNPGNVVTLRNCIYADHREQILHANFSILCDFCENVMGGAEKWSERIETLEDHWKESETALLNLYNWYNSIDWKNPVPCTEEHSKILEKINWEFNPTDSTEEYYTMDLVGDEESVKTYKVLSKERTEKLDDFELEVQSNLIKLISLREFMWI